MKKRNNGFTLIEVLMVVVLIGIALSVSAPYLVNSIRGQRIRTASRTMIMSARYARSMAVLNQADVTLEFDMESGDVSIGSDTAALPAFSRELKGVRLAYVTLYNRDPVTEGRVVVLCRKTGVCDPFTAKIEDAHGNSVIVNIDALASAKTTEIP